MNAFLTGSRAYGAPRPDSDIDVVVRVDEALEILLRANSSAKGDPLEPVKFSYSGTVEVNLILCTSDAMYNAWRFGTSKLMVRSQMAKRPILRDEAIACFAELKAAEGVTPSTRKDEAA